MTMRALIISTGLAAATLANAGTTDTIFASGFDADVWVQGYYVGYERDLYPIEDVDFGALTHLMVGRVRPLPDGTVTRDFDIDEPVQAIEMRATKDQSRVYVAMGRANRGAELDPVSGKVLRWWPTGERTWGIGLSPDETRLYAASGLSGTLTLIDLKRGKVIDTVKLGGRPWGAIAAPK